MIKKFGLIKTTYPTNEVFLAPQIDFFDSTPPQRALSEAKALRPQLENVSFKICASLLVPKKFIEPEAIFLAEEIKLTLRKLAPISSEAITHLWLDGPISPCLAQGILACPDISVIICPPSYANQISEMLICSLTSSVRRIPQVIRGAQGEISTEEGQSSDCDVHPSNYTQDSVVLISHRIADDFLLQKLQLLLHDFQTWLFNYQDLVCGDAMYAKFDRALYAILVALDVFSKISFNHSMIAARVAVDELFYPDVDPTMGWLKHNFNQKDTSLHYVDTQLMRLFFNDANTGEICSWEYKPRRTELAPRLKSLDLENAPWNGSGNSLFFVTASESQQLECNFLSSPLSILKQTPDLLAVRFKCDFQFFTQFKNKLKPITSCCEYTFHAGVGSHRPYSTTGFTAEYWLEGESNDLAQLDFAISFNLQLPSARPRNDMARLLYAVGAVSDDVYYCERDLLFTTDDVAAAMYGLRIVDSIDGSYIDYRFSRPLTKIKSEVVGSQSTVEDIINPKEELETSKPQIAEVLRLSFFMPAIKIKSIDKSISLFTSIN